MNVDKFGHHIFKRKRIKNENESIQCALIPTSDGNLSVQNKIIKGVLMPIDADNSATKEYVDKSIFDTYKSIKSLECFITEINGRLKNLEQIVNLNKNKNK